VEEQRNMQRHTGREMWDLDECQSPRMGSVILGVDGGASNTVCVCIPAAMPSNDPLPVLSRTVAGCSNHNSVGGNLNHHLLLTDKYPALMTHHQLFSSYAQIRSALKGFVLFLFFLVSDCSEERARETLECYRK
jgi:hypothetical protein